MGGIVLPYFCRNLGVVFVHDFATGWRLAREEVNQVFGARRSLTEGGGKKSSGRFERTNLVGQRRKRAIRLGACFRDVDQGQRCSRVLPGGIGGGRRAEFERRGLDVIQGFLHQFL